MLHGVSSGGRYKLPDAPERNNLSVSLGGIDWGLLDVLDIKL